MVFMRKNYLHFTSLFYFACFSRVKCKTLQKAKTLIIRITLGLSEAAVRSLAKGARHEIAKATSKRACNKAMTV
jgi:hypothetical protein